MTALDILVLVLVGGGAVHGAMRGFTFEVMTLMSWVVGVIALRMFHTPVYELLLEPVGTASGAAVLAFVLVFGMFFFGTRLIGRRFGVGVRESFVGTFDRILGFGFGALKGLVIVTLLFLLANLATDIVYGGDAERPGWMVSSRTFPLLNASGRAIVDFVEMRRAAEEPAVEAD